VCQEQNDTAITLFLSSVVGMVALTGSGHFIPEMIKDAQPKLRQLAQVSYSQQPMLARLARRLPF